MAVSQKQIAERLQVSIALVSRVLSGRAEEIGIAPQTIERVLITAREMGYVPSAAALSLKGKATQTIGVAVYDFTDPFFGALIQQIQIQAHHHDYSLVLTGFLDRTPDSQDLRSLHKHAIEGLIILGSDPDAQWLNEFQGLPTARIGHASPSETSVRVTVDEEDAAHQLILHLTNRGCKRIAYLRGSQLAHILRQQAFEQEAEKQGVQLDTVSMDDHDMVSCGQHAALHTLETMPEVDALVCATDLVAIGALQILHKEGIEIPNKIAVTGFDGIAVSEQFIPAITTLQQPLPTIVEQAFAAIHNATPPQEIPIPGKLVVREST